MTRPRKNTVDYFPHDVHHGQTLFVLEMKHGNDGYAFWFKLLEMLGGSESHFLDLNLPERLHFLSAKSRVSEQSCVDMLSLLADMGAIDRELWGKRIVWCQNFVNRVSDVYTRNRHVDAPRRPLNYAEKPRAEGTTTQGNPQSKVKERKEKERKENPPTPLSSADADGSVAGIPPEPDLQPSSSPKPPIKQRETWLTPYAETWKKHMGGDLPFGEAAKVLKSLHADPGPDRLCKAMAWYLLHTEARYISISRFAERWKKIEDEMNGKPTRESKYAHGFDGKRK